MFEERNIEFVHIEDFYKFSENGYDVEKLVLITKQGNTNSYVDIGSLCYAKRSKSCKTNHNAKVIKSTFNEKIASAIKEFLDYKCTKLTVGSARVILGRLKVTLDELYSIGSEQNIEISFDDINQCHIIYDFYTKFLIAKIKNEFKNPNFKSTKNIAARQKICAELISSTCNVDLEDFMGKYINIKGYDSPNKDKEVSETEDYRVYLNNCQKIYKIFSQFSLSNGNFPINFNINGNISEVPSVLYITRTSALVKKYFYNKEGRFLNRIEAVQNVKKIDDVDELKIRYKDKNDELPFDLKKSYNKHLKMLLNANRHNSRERLKVINIAMSSMALWIITDSGCNLSVIYGLQTQDLKNLNPDVPNQKIFYVKERSGGGTVAVGLTNKIVQPLKDFLAFREYVLNLVDKKERKKIGNYVFFTFKLNANKNIKDLIGLYSDKDLNLYKNWYNSIFGKGSYIGPRVGRGSHANIYKNLERVENYNQAIDISAEILGHTSTVDFKHYTDATKEQVRSQFTKFFDNVYDHMIFKNRTTRKTIPVITDIESSPTMAGHCTDTSPIRADGFNENIEQPNCSNPSTCLFCENYVLHTDEIDLRKLLSLRKITEMHSDINEEMLIVKFRIDEILKQIVNKYDHVKSLIHTIKAEVDDGYFDENWQNILELLIDLGVQFYVED
ncbi:hypothetical protein [Acinetobacter sp.]|uniref:hypothetical protein n=1 Tax=Acinetobacter sp. TaxID=472 RepID=UPI003753A8BB